MEASIVDLRYKMKEVLKALRHNEPVKILYHGKLTGTIIPVQPLKQHQVVEEHPFFGMHKKHKLSVKEQLNQLRSIRYKD